MMEEEDQFGFLSWMKLFLFLNNIISIIEVCSVIHSIIGEEGRGDPKGTLKTARRSYREEALNPLVVNINHTLDKDIIKWSSIEVPVYFKEN